MSFSIGFRGVGDQAARDAKRKLRRERIVQGAGQEASPHNATLDAISGVVAMLAKQYPESMIEGMASGHLGWEDGSAQFSFTVREARQGELEANEPEGDEEPTPQDRRAAGPTEQAKDEQTKVASGPAQPPDRGVVPSGSQPAQPQPPRPNSGPAVGNSGSTQQAGSKPAGGTPPSNA